MADIQLGLLFPGEAPQPARQVARALLEQRTIDGQPWTLVWGRDPDREQQEEREGTSLDALRQHLSEAAAGFGLWVSAVLDLPELGHLRASVQVFEDASLNEALLSIDEDILFSRGAEAQVVGALLALGATLLETHSAPLGFLGREASGADLGVSALSDVSREDLLVFELAFWPESSAQFPVTADLYRLQTVIIQCTGRSLGPEPVSGPIPSGLGPIVLDEG